MTHLSGNHSYFQPLGELHISSEIIDGEQRVIAKQNVQLADGRVLTVTAHYRQGASRESIEDGIGRTVEKMVNIAILHELGNDERTHPAKRLKLKSNGSFYKEYVEEERSVKVTPDYKSLLAAKHEKYESFLSSSEAGMEVSESYEEVQRKFSAVCILEGYIQDIPLSDSTTTPVDAEVAPSFMNSIFSISERIKKPLEKYIGKPLTDALMASVQESGSAAASVKALLLEFNKELTNPFDPEWRRDTKYSLILEQISLNVLETILPNHRETLQDWIVEAKNREIQSENVINGSELEMEQHLKNALSCLFNHDLYFNTERDRYLAFMKHYTGALESAPYRVSVKGGEGGKSCEDLALIERESFYVGLIHALAFSELLGVNTQGFSQGISRGLALEGGYEEVWNCSKQEPMRALEEAAMQLDLASQGIQNASDENKTHKRTKLASDLVGEHSIFDFDPLVTGGNPANVKAVFGVVDGGAERVMVRTPSPTKGEEITPMFKAYLRALKARGKKHVYINLQDRRPPMLKENKGKYGGILGFTREDIRSRAIERLNEDPEFSGAITVFSFDKNSSWYWQSVSTKRVIRSIKDLKRQGLLEAERVKELKKNARSHGRQSDAIEELISVYRINNLEVPVEFYVSKNDFQNELKERLRDHSSAYSFPPGWLDERGGDVDRIIDLVGEHLFFDKDELTTKERQDYLEAVYDFVFLYILKEEDPAAFNSSCKDCIDRGGGATWLLMGALLMVEAESCKDGDRKAQLVRDARSLVSKFNEDAVWARKRHAIDDRRHRARNVFTRLLENREHFISLVNHLRDETLYQDMILKSAADPEQMAHAEMQIASENQG